MLDKFFHPIVNLKFNLFSAGHSLLKKMADKIRFIKKVFCGADLDKTLLQDVLSPKKSAFKREGKERRQKDF